MADLSSSSITGVIINKKGTSAATNVDISNSTMFTGSSRYEYATEMMHVHFEIAFDQNTANRFVVVWADEDNSNRPTARIGTIIDKDITWGVAVVIDTNTVGNGPLLNVAFDPNTADRFVVTYNDGKMQARTGTITGINTITFSSAYTFGGNSQFSTGSPASAAMAFDPNTTGKFVLVYREPSGTYGYAMVGVIATNGSISTGTELGFSAVSTDKLDIEFDPNNANKFLISWVDSVSPYHGNTLVGTVSGTGFASWGTLVKFSTDATVTHPTISFDPNTANKFVVSYVKDWSSAKDCCCKVGNLSGTTITYGTEAVYRSSGGYGKVAFNPSVAGEFIVAFRKLSTYDGFAIKGTVTYGSPDTIAYTGTGIEFRDGANINWAFLSLAFDPNSRKFVIAHGFRDAYNETSGHVKVGQLEESKITVDLATGISFELDLQTMNQDITIFTISNPSATNTSSFILKITQGSTARQINWSKLTNIKWPSDEGPNTPTLTVTDNAVDILSFTTYDNGTTWHGSVVGQNFI